MLTRRHFLKNSSLIALAPSVPAFLARTARAAEPDRERRVLVVVQLGGGNDGINMVVPFADEGYARHRRALRLPAERLIKLNDHVGLHPAMADAARLLDAGRLAIVQGVGYPNPNRSHDVSMAIWQTARFDPEEHRTFGWLGRALDAAPPTAGEPGAMLVGEDASPVALRGRRTSTVALSSFDELSLPREAAAVRELAAGGAGDDLTAFVRRSTLDACAAADRLAALAHRPERSAPYPGSDLARRLEMVARLLKADFATRVFYLGQGGYDTHAAQLDTHAQLLRTLSGALGAFLDDLAAAGQAERVAVLCFSEFGRRVEENASQGTDHGTAAPVLLAGGAVHSGLHGATPSLTDLADGDLRMSVDFRSVYATLLDDWLGIPSRDVLAGQFEKLPLIANKARLGGSPPRPLQ